MLFFRDLCNDVLYWQLLDQGIKPCKNWKMSWEIIENEREHEKKDVYSRVRKQKLEKSSTLKEIRLADNYYDAPEDETDDSDTPAHPEQQQIPYEDNSNDSLSAGEQSGEGEDDENHSDDASDE